MEIVKAILVDDEVSNLKGLQRKVNTLFPEIEVVGEKQQDYRTDI